uniref:Zinc-binding protein A33-like n=1 Tax=Scleropages formosus TaxID=113540 RepID=A0A8C9TNC0_SCLFO
MFFLIFNSLYISAFIVLPRARSLPPRGGTALVHGTLLRGTTPGHRCGPVEFPRASAVGRARVVPVVLAMAASSERSALDELRSELTCPVCLELFREPVILECGHHFCRACIARCWEARSEEGATCPQCRAPCASELRPNSLLCNVVDSVRRARATHTGARVALTTRRHEEKLKLFCEEDQAAICVVCGMSRLHRTHSVVPIKEAADGYKQGAALEDQIAHEFRQLRDFLEREEDQVRGHLRQEKDRRLRQLDESLKRSTEQMALLEMSAEQLELRLRQEENPFLLRVRSCGGNEDKGCSEGKQRVRPMGVTLDPDTAYPRLTVSACRTSVCVGEIQPNLPDNPERFTRYNIVLGSQGFLSGRRYWEVEVGDKTAWGLGVAAESVNRKKEISLCPEDGFWTLVLRNGDEYEACTSTENLLRLPRKPRRIGIYLDYPPHLFTFSDSFSERVYPYFNPWPIINGRNSEPLRIVTLPL